MTTYSCPDTGDTFADEAAAVAFVRKNRRRVIVSDAPGTYRDLMDVLALKAGVVNPQGGPNSGAFEAIFFAKES